MSDHTSVTHRLRVTAFLAIVACALVMRILPYVLHTAFGMSIEYAYSVFPWNFSPMYAIAIFGGAYFSRRMAIAVPIAIFFVSDLAIASLMETGWGSYRDQPFTYAAFALLAVCGMPLRGERSMFDIAAAGLGGAILFFLISNFGVWLFGGGLYHPRTLTGLLLCYRDGLPFFTPTVASLALFLPVLFSPLVLARESLRAEPQPVV